MGELKKSRSITKNQYEKLMLKVDDGGKTCSISRLGKLLEEDILRTHLQSQFVDTGRLITEIISDPSLSCFTKLTMMRCYPTFIRAIADPKTLVRWGK